MRKVKADPEIKCRVVPIQIWDDHPHDADTQREVFLTITGQLISFLEAALKDRDDPDRPLRIIAKAERLVATYTSEGFYLLEPFHRDLRDTLHTAFRMARRQFIRRALRCQPHETERFVRHFRKPEWEGAEAMEDYWAVESALREGRNIFEDLHRDHRRRVVG